MSQSPGCSFSHLTPAGILARGSFSFLFSLCLLYSVTLVGDGVAGINRVGVSVLLAKLEGG